MPSGVPHVVAYTDATGRGGGEMSLGNLLGALDPSFRITVLGVENEVVEWIAARRPGVDRRVLPVVRGPWDVGRIAAHLGAIVRLRPDILHLNLRTPWSCWYGMLGGLLSPGTATVAVEQLPIRTGSVLHRRWRRWLARRLDAHIAVGERSARETEAFVGLPAGSVQSVPNYVPDHGPVRRVLHEGVVLGAIGRLDPQKGFDVLLTALSGLPDVRLVILGEGAARHALEQQIRRLGLAPRVTLAGWSDSVREPLATVDVLVLPSRSEGFPLTIVEAMLAGLPVVATNVGSVAEAVRDGETGLLVPKDDPGALAAALRKVAESPDLRAQFGRRGREMAAEAFTVTHMARRYEHVYARVLQKGGHGAAEPGG